MKVCTKCLLEKPPSEFHKNSYARDGLQTRCKRCVNMHMRIKRATFPAKYKRIDDTSRAKVKYGITLEQREALLRAQDGVCAICEQVELIGIGLAVDHDHVTGKIRGLLCMRCNTALGRFRDDPKLLRRAAEYLEGELDGKN